MSRLAGEKDLQPLAPIEDVDRALALCREVKVDRNTIDSFLRGPGDEYLAQFVRSHFGDLLAAMLAVSATRHTPPYGESWHAELIFVYYTASTIFVKLNRVYIEKFLME